MTFEQAMERLEQISKILSENQLSIDESLELYAEGAKLINFCSEKLQSASIKIEEINSKIDEGV